MFTKATINGEAVVALAPLSVLSEYQRQGRGMALIKEGHRIAAELGNPYSIVLGSETYYPITGYQPAQEFGIRAPFYVPSKNFMAYKLKDDALPLCRTVKYAKEFGIANELMASYMHTTRSVVCAVGIANVW